jgi:hypothetical protein
MNTQYRIAAGSRRISNSWMLSAATALTLVLSTAAGYAQNHPGVDCSMQKAAEGGNGTNLQKAAEGGNGTNLQKAAEGGNGTNLQKAAEGGNGFNLQKAAASGTSGPVLAANAMPPCAQ